MTATKFQRLPQPYIGRLICELHKESGLSEEEFASYFHVIIPTINRWERKQVRPSPMAQRLIFSELEKMGDRGKMLFERYQTHALK
ncbi:DNA-binding transcriptional regulator [Myxosarcina sp. GI1]|uniref:helix-turn-helix domain-containing protein n=1 Tax=Myxosarcina sp. GI1 TaxID=1541065 RepID=UPI0005618AB5|nr:hypothetical protein [Myxosarcina sp. GI1]